MDTKVKAWYKSKLFWQNVFVSLIGILMLVADFWARTPVLTVSGVCTLLAGAFGIVMRTFFTSEPISTFALSRKQTADRLREISTPPSIQPK
jgi:hypothetical protein